MISGEIMIIVARSIKLVSALFLILICLPFLFSCSVRVGKVEDVEYHFLDTYNKDFVAKPTPTPEAK